MGLIIKNDFSEVLRPLFIAVPSYVDDKFSQALAEGDSKSVSHAMHLMQTCNSYYRDTLKIGTEDPIADGIYIYLGHLLIHQSPLHCQKHLLHSDHW